VGKTKEVKVWHLCDSCHVYLDEDINHVTEQFVNEDGFIVIKCRTISRANTVTAKDLDYIRESLGVSEGVALG